jgi:hypothetical protein
MNDDREKQRTFGRRTIEVSGQILQELLFPNVEPADAEIDNIVWDTMYDIALVTLTSLEFSGDGEGYAEVHEGRRHVIIRDAAEPQGGVR